MCKCIQRKRIHELIVVVICGERTGYVGDGKHELQHYFSFFISVEFYFLVFFNLIFILYWSIVDL